MPIDLAPSKSEQFGFVPSDSEQFSFVPFESGPFDSVPSDYGPFGFKPFGSVQVVVTPADFAVTTGANS